jgi:hypothetical protein
MSYTTSIGIYNNCSDIRSISVRISIPNAALEEIGRPKELVFSESDLSLSVCSLNTRKAYRVSTSRNFSSISICPTLHDREALLGHWRFVVDDLSIVLTEKIK